MEVPVLNGYTAFMLVATALVLMMTVPALALFYGGMTRTKSVLNMMNMSFIAFALVAIVFFLWGWSEGGWTNGFGNGKLISNPFSMFGLHNESWGNFVTVLFQMTFACITAALISGAIADRVKIVSWGIFVVLWVTLCYFPVAHNIWGGGWFYTKFPNLDYAGGTVVHINAGIAGLVLALIIGKRVGFGKEPMKPHNVTMTMIGAGLLWFGWYGFNVGSIVVSASDDKTWNSNQYPFEMGVTFLNTTAATAIACLAWLLTERIVHGKFTSLGAASGIVAGLVAITPSCGAVNLLGALIIGAVAGIVCSLAVGLKYKFGFDDSLDVVGVHLVGGILGAVLIGLVGTDKSPTGLDGFFGGMNGLFYGGNATLLGHQILGVLFTVIWTGVITAILGFAIKFTIGWRVTEEAEVEGIDFDQHGESAYDITPGTGVLA
jgi:ammonium transporter, Amt family